MSPHNLRVVLVSLFLFVFGFALYEELLPIYARILGASGVELGVLFTISQVMLTVGVLLGGFLADRYGARNLMLASWIGSVPVPLLYLLAGSWAWLLPGVVLFNLTYSGLPALNAYLSGLVRRERIASTFGIVGAASSAGSFLGRGLGGVLAERFGISLNFALAFLCFAASTAALFLTERERRMPHESLPIREAFRLRGFAGLWLFLTVLAVINAIPIAVFPFVPPFLREVRGLGLAQIGFLGSMLSVGAFIAAYSVGRIADRVGHAAALIGAAMTCAAGNFLVVLGPAGLLPIAFIIRTARGIGVASEAIVSSVVGAGEFGRAFGVWYTIMGTAAAVGTFLGGIGYRTNPALPLLLAPGILIALALVAAWQSGQASRLLMRKEMRS